MRTVGWNGICTSSESTSSLSHFWDYAPKEKKKGQESKVCAPNEIVKISYVVERKDLDSMIQYNITVFQFGSICLVIIFQGQIIPCLLKQDHACKVCLQVTSALNPEFNHFHFIVVVSHGEIMYQDLWKKKPLYNPCKTKAIVFHVVAVAADLVRSEQVPVSLAPVINSRSCLSYE